MNRVILTGLVCGLLLGASGHTCSDEPATISGRTLTQYAALLDDAGLNIELDGHMLISLPRIWSNDRIFKSANPLDFRLDNITRVDRTHPGGGPG